MRRFAVWGVGSGLTFANGWDVSLALCGEIKSRDDIKSADLVEIGVNSPVGESLFEDYLTVTPDMATKVMGVVAKLPDGTTATQARSHILGLVRFPFCNCLKPRYTGDHVPGDLGCCEACGKRISAG
jgi:hypothetical protein